MLMTPFWWCCDYDGHADNDDADDNFDHGSHHGPLRRCLVWEVCWGPLMAGKSFASHWQSIAIAKHGVNIAIAIVIAT